MTFGTLIYIQRWTFYSWNGCSEARAGLQTAKHPGKREVPHAAGRLLPRVLARSRQHIVGKDGVWFGERTVVIRVTLTTGDAVGLPTTRE